MWTNHRAFRRLEEVTNELKTLRGALSLDNPSASQTSLPDELSRIRLNKPSESAETAAESTPSQSSSYGEDAWPQRWVDLDRHDPNALSSSFMLGNVSISGETAFELFRHYGRYYYRQLPILANVESIAALHHSNALLFWTILLVSSQWHPTLSNLYLRLVEPHEALLATILHSAIQPIETVHALLILCLWPVPKVRQVRHALLSSS